MENKNNYTQNNTKNNTKNPYVSVNNDKKNDNLLSSFNTNDFLKGVLIGATAGYLLTNEKAQKSIMKTFAKGANMLQMGVEELKERFEDVKAEMEQ